MFPFIYKYIRVSFSFDIEMLIFCDANLNFIFINFVLFIYHLYDILLLSRRNNTERFIYSNYWFPVPTSRWHKP